VILSYSVAVVSSVGVIRAKGMVSTVFVKKGERRSLSVGVVMVHPSLFVSTVFQFLAICPIVRFLPFSIHTNGYFRSA
jgi:hypothetical protein